MADLLQSLSRSRAGIALALGLSRSLPPWAGYPFAHRLGRWIASHPSAQTKAVRLNQWVASGGRLSASELDQRVREVFSLNARSLYDLYHYMNNTSMLLRLVKLAPATQQVLERTHQRQQGAVIVVPHISNFDLAGRVVGLNQADILLLAASSQAGGYQMQNMMRRHIGLEVYPISPASLRMTVERLEAGGAVMTGVDWPQPGEKYRPRFFGQPACMPTLHVRLALRSGAPVVIMACRTLPDHTYEIIASDPIHMVRCPDQKEEVIYNTELVLRQVENIICQVPQQWVMFYPLWPEVENEVP